MTGVERRLIVNGDDFGRSEMINQGIIQAHEQGILTSASLMVRWPAAEAAGLYARDTPGLSVGLHLDLSEWRFEGEWRPVYEVLPVLDPGAVRRELDRQLDLFQRHVGRAPTNLDSHQHVHRDEPVRSALLDAGERLGVPVRDCTPSVAYLGSFYGQDGRGYPYPEGISAGHLLELISTLSEGVTELGCHPANEPEVESSYADERPVELAVLCDPSIRAAVRTERIRLCNFANALPGGRAPTGGPNA